MSYESTYGRHAFNQMAAEETERDLRRSERQRKQNPQAEVDAFNARFEIGAEVDYAEVIGETTKRYRTRTEASVLSGHTAVVWLDGKSGCVCISHCSAPEGDAA